MSNEHAASDISVRERDTSRRFKKLGVRAAREEKARERKRKSPTNQVLYREKSSLLVRRKKLRLKILSWGVERPFRHGRVEDGSFRRVRSNMK